MSEVYFIVFLFHFQWVAVLLEGVWSQSVTTHTAHHIPNTPHPMAPTVMVQAGYLVSKQ